MPSENGWDVSTRFGTHSCPRTQLGGVAGSITPIFGETWFEIRAGISPYVVGGRFSTYDSPFETFVRASNGKDIGAWEDVKNPAHFVPGRHRGRLVFLAVRG